MASGYFQQGENFRLRKYRTISWRKWDLTQAVKRERFLPGKWGQCSVRWQGDSKGGKKTHKLEEQERKP